MRGDAGLAHKPEAKGRSVIKTSVVIVRSEHPAFGSLRSILSNDPDLTIVAELHDYGHAAQAIATLLPDVAVAPATLRGKPIWPILHQLRQRCPGTAVVVIAGAVTDLTEMPSTGLQAEACILWADATPAKLQHVLSSVLTHRFVLGSHEIAEAFLDGKCFVSHRSIPPLAPREQQVLEAVIKGQSDQEIALRLNIKPSTVSVHLRHIREKVGASSRSQLCYLAGRDAVAR